MVTGKNILDDKNRVTLALIRLKPSANQIQILTLVLLALFLLISCSNLKAQAVGQIVFVRSEMGEEGNIIVLDLATGEETQLADGNYRNPVWSPDGSMVAYSEYRATTGYNTYTIELNGSSSTTIDELEDIPSFYGWSPNNAQLLFGDNRNPRDIFEGDIYVMDFDGNNEILLTDNDLNDDKATWSPDGSQIAFVRNEETDSISSAIYIMNADGSDQIPLTDSSSFNAYAPVWSPDGSQIAFLAIIDNGVSIYVMNADGTDQQHLLTPNSVNRTLTWSPDGSQIAFSGLSVDRNRDIFIVNADGTNLTQITNTLEDENHPVWRPISD